MTDVTVTSMDQLLTQMVQLNASDLHVTVGSPPVVRLKGHLQRFDGVASLSADDTRELLYRILSSEQQKKLEINRQLDFAHSIPGVARFRVNCFFQRETLGAAFRLIPNEIKTLEELGLSSALHQLSEKPRGLVLVTGPTGSGKSTTLA
jgi:twitching motility protein PilT